MFNDYLLRRRHRHRRHHQLYEDVEDGVATKYDTAACCRRHQQQQQQQQNHHHQGLLLRRRRRRRRRAEHLSQQSWMTTSVLLLLLLLMLTTTLQQAVVFVEGFVTPQFYLNVKISPPRPPPTTTTTPSTTTVLFMGLRGKKLRRERRRARKEPTPPRISTPYGPIRMPKPPRVCGVCVGRGVVRCNVCEGKSVVRATGQTRKNQLPTVDKLPKSLWTSVEKTQFGHRHHSIKECRGSKKKGNLEVMMINNCGQDQTPFWVSADELKDKSCWRKGWVTLAEIRQADGGALYDVALCFRCKGDRILTCAECGGQGEIESFEPLWD